jgi:hypothetical protein
MESNANDDDDDHWLSRIIGIMRSLFGIFLLVRFMGPLIVCSSPSSDDHEGEDYQSCKNKTTIITTTTTTMMMKNE